MKKFIMALLIVLVTSFVFAETYEVEVKGTVYKQTPDGEVPIKLEEKDFIDDEDEIIIGKDGLITFWKNGKKIVLKGGTYKVKDLK